MYNPLSEKFKIGTLLRFTAPTVAMMVLMSLYTMVDGVFVSNIIGKDALAAVNIVYPAYSVVIAIAIMLASGGSAVISRDMGQKEDRRAKENFTLIVVVGIVAGVVFAFLGTVFAENILKALGSTPLLHSHAMEYMQTLSCFAPLAILQMLFQFFFVTAGKPNLGLLSTAAGGVANIVLDYFFMTTLKMGIKGAALATGIGFAVPAVVGLIWFIFDKKSTLHFVKPKWRTDVLINSCFNGSSEMVTNLSTAVTTFLFNLVMLKYLGEDGVASITIVLYSQFLLTAVYLGFSSGVAPVISYNYGEKNGAELKKLFKMCVKIICATSVLMLAASVLLSNNIISIFVPKGSSVFEITEHGLRLFSINYLFAGINIFASSMFTAFSDGKVSAIISFLRTFVFIILSALFLPMLLDIDGVWLAIPIAEMLTLFVSVWYIIKYKDYYEYM